ncbi:hypothetical protein ABZS79_34730 [Streptomyces griseoloalbus]|uniref:hypothetical protein n=1 Tax=Streptomyces griseoloalbus TaxID=67303 RepID=UPI0033B9A190
MTRPARTAALFAGVVARPGEQHLGLAAGDALGAAGYGLRHGGYNGLMGAAAQGAARHNVPVTAITLADREEWGPFNPYVTHAVYTPTMGERLHAYLDDVDLVVVELPAVLLHLQQAREQGTLKIDPGLHRVAVAELLDELDQDRLHRLMARVHHRVVGAVGVGVEQAHRASVAITGSLAVVFRAAEAMFEAPEHGV